jgi:hypothetical protein
VTALESVEKPKEVQIMTKTRKATASGTATRSLRKTALKSAAPREAQGQTATAAAAAVLDTTLPGTPARQTKKGSILALLQRSKGAAISDLIAATGWQVHSVRAALTGLRNEGKELLRNKDEAGITLYRIAEER